MTKLKPCPFCGSSPVQTSREEFEADPDAYPYGFGIHCINPNCLPNSDEELWNTRMGMTVAEAWAEARAKTLKENLGAWKRLAEE